MNQLSIRNWLTSSSYDNITKKNIFENKYFYLKWYDHKNYEIFWTNIIPENFNYRKIIKIKEFNTEIVVLGNILSNYDSVSLFDKYNKYNKNYYTKNISFLKSHLQKCLRIGNINKSIITAYLLMEININQFLRRFPIIILEDIYLIKELDIIIWFMIMSDLIIIPDSFKKWILGLIKFLCTYKKKLYYNKSINYPNYNGILNISSKNKSIILSLIIRKSYGGMKGDILMLNYIIEDWIINFNNNVELDEINIKTITIIDILDPEQYEISAVDFHCYPQIIDILNEYYPKFHKNTIKNTIWLKSSSLNYRIKYSNEKNIEIEECWNTIKYKLFKIQKNYILNKIFKIH